MGRGEDKNTIGTWVESKVQDAITLTGLGTGSAAGFSLIGASATNSISSPEGLAVTAGAIGSLAAGGLAGGKVAGKVDGTIADKIDRKKPSRLQNGEIHLDSRDPFELGITNGEFQQLDDKQIDQVREYTGDQSPNKFDLYQMEQEQDQVDEWVDEKIFGDINGLQGEYKTNINYSGDFKTGYVDRDQEEFVQAPRNGDTFDEAMERVQTWKENKETLDQADQYLDEILEKEGKRTASTGLVDIEINYDLLRENEDTLREELEGGISTPSENYDIVVTSHDGDPLPVLVGDFNSEMIERGSDLYDLENSEEVQERKQVLGMYMDALMEEEEFEGHIADYWFSEGQGRENTKNMFYDPETDTVGVTDIGEYVGEEPEEVPEVSVEERYA